MIVVKAIVCVALLLNGILHISAKTSCPTGCEQCKCIGIDWMMCDFDDGTMLPSCLTFNLSSLILKKSSILKLDGEDFIKAPNLQRLQITDSPLASIAIGTFNNTSSLRELTLDNNQLSGFDDGLFAEVSDLTSLSAERNNIVQITNCTFEGLNHLVTLSLKSNQIVDLQPHALAPLERLEVLNLAGNALVTLGEDVGLANLLNLQELILSHNNIQHIEDQALAINFALTRLELNENSLRELLPNTFHNQHSLVYLDLAGNHLTSVDKALKLASSLETLILDNNNITELGPNSFEGMDTLMHLHINGMESLRYIQDGTFNAVVNLKELSVAGNTYITSFSEKVIPSSDLHYLETLILKNNSITAFDMNMFMNLENLERADIYGNPIQCSCNVNWMRTLMDEDTITWVKNWKSGPHAPTCGSPRQFHGSSIYELEDLDQMCMTPIHIYSEMTSISSHDALWEIRFYCNYDDVWTKWRLPDGREVTPMYPLPNTSLGSGILKSKADVRAEQRNLGYSFQGYNFLAKLTVHNPHSSPGGTYTFYVTRGGVIVDTRNVTLSIAGMRAILIGVVIIIIIVVAAMCVCLGYCIYRRQRIGRMGTEAAGVLTDPSTVAETDSLISAQNDGAYGATSCCT